MKDHVVLQSNVPSYLQDGTLFKLSGQKRKVNGTSDVLGNGHCDDHVKDETVSFPQDSFVSHCGQFFRVFDGCFKQDTNVESYEDAWWMMRTLLFWELTCLPVTLIQFLLHTPCSQNNIKLENAIDQWVQEFGSAIPCLPTLWILRQKEVIVEKSRALFACNRMSTAIDKAASPEIISQLCSIHEDLSDVPPERIVDLVQHICVLDKYRPVHNEVCKWLVVNRADMDWYDCAFFAEHGQCDALEALSVETSDLIYATETCIEAVQENNFDFLKVQVDRLRRSDVFFDEELQIQISNAIASSGDVDMFCWFIDPAGNACKWDKKAVCFNAFYEQHFHFVNYVLESEPKGFILPMLKEFLSTALFEKEWTMVKWICQQMEDCQTETSNVEL